jgi:hypothetical protein
MQIRVVRYLVKMANVTMANGLSIKVRDVDIIFHTYLPRYLEILPLFPYLNLSYLLTLRQCTFCSTSDNNSCTDDTGANNDGHVDH